MSTMERTDGGFWALITTACEVEMSLFAATIVRSLKVVVLWESARRKYREKCARITRRVNGFPGVVSGTIKCFQ